MADRWHRWHTVCIWNSKVTGKREITVDGYSIPPWLWDLGHRFPRYFLYLAGAYARMRKALRATRLNPMAEGEWSKGNSIRFEGDFYDANLDNQEERES